LLLAAGSHYFLITVFFDEAYEEVRRPVLSAVFAILGRRLADIDRVTVHPP
jgi:hypothetical protein